MAEEISKSTKWLWLEIVSVDYVVVLYIRGGVFCYWDFVVTFLPVPNNHIFSNSKSVI